MDKEEIEYQKAVKELEKAKAEYKETVKAYRKDRNEGFLNFFKRWFIELPNSFLSGFKKGMEEEDKKK